MQLATGYVTALSDSTHFITANVKRSLHVRWAENEVPYLDYLQAEA